MMRSMYAGVSGLQSHQTRMDVIGNNIANVNTTGFKSSRVTFQDTLNQMLRGASASQSNRGGTNPLQVGLGVSVSSIDVIHTQGNLQTTGNTSDLAIQGNGFFVLSNGSKNYYTRAGNFTMEETGLLVNPSNGLVVQGWMADVAGNIDTNTTTENIKLPLGQTIAPSATTSIEFGGNLDSGTAGELTYSGLTMTDVDGNGVQLVFTLNPTNNFNEFTYTVSVDGGIVTNGTASGTIALNLDGSVASITGAPFEITATGGTNPITVTPPIVGAANGGSFTTDSTGATSFAGVFTAPEKLVTSTEIFDSLGQAHYIATTLEKVDLNTWNWTTTDQLGNVIGNGNMIYDTNGKLISSSGTTITLSPAGADNITINPDFSKVSQYASTTSEITSPYQDGYSMGTLESYSIDGSGILIGVFSNGLSQNLAQISIANFTNAAGLVKTGDSLYESSSNSGTAQIGVAGESGRGKVASGNLEMSNVDLAQEFTDMIVTQRGYQANSRIITTSDEMLEELVNLKR